LTREKVYKLKITAVDKFQKEMRYAGREIIHSDYWNSFPCGKTAEEYVWSLMASRAKIRNSWVLFPLASTSSHLRAKAQRQYTAIVAMAVYHMNSSLKIR
jgi:hypothetical protein